MKFYLMIHLYHINYLLLVLSFSIPWQIKNVCKLCWKFWVKKDRKTTNMTYYRLNNSFISLIYIFMQKELAYLSLSLSNGTNTESQWQSIGRMRQQLYCQSRDWNFSSLFSEISNDISLWTFGWYCNIPLYT